MECTVLFLKTDGNSFGTDIAALVQTVCIGFHLCTLRAKQHWEHLTTCLASIMIHLRTQIFYQADAVPEKGENAGDLATSTKLQRYFP